MVEAIRAASVVVTHAGVGSVMVSLANGKCPVVVPRRKAFARGGRRPPAPARPPICGIRPRHARRGSRRARRRTRSRPALGADRSRDQLTRSRSVGLPDDCDSSARRRRMTPEPVRTDSIGSRVLSGIAWKASSQVIAPDHAHGRRARARAAPDSARLGARGDGHPVLGLHHRLHRQRVRHGPDPAPRPARGGQVDRVLVQRRARRRCWPSPACCSRSRWRTSTASPRFAGSSSHSPWASSSTRSARPRWRCSSARCSSGGSSSARWLRRSSAR